MTIAPLPAFNAAETYTLAPTGGVIRGSDGAHIPADPLNMGWVAYQAWIASGKTPTPAPTPPLATVQAQAVAEMAAWADAAVAPYEAGVSAAERASWPVKLAEARDLTATPAIRAAAQCPVLSAEAGVTGETVPALAATVLTKAAQYQTITGMMAGLRRTATTAIMAATTAAGVQAALTTAKAAAAAALAKIGAPA